MMRNRARRTSDLVMKKVASLIILKVMDLFKIQMQLTQPKFQMSIVDFNVSILLLKDSTKVMRGCTLDMDRSDTQWCNEEDGCETCSTPGCNMEAEQLI